MLRDLIEDELVDVALNHKKEISNIVKPYVAQTLRKTLR